MKRYIMSSFQKVYEDKIVITITRGVPFTSAEGRKAMLPVTERSYTAMFSDRRKAWQLGLRFLLLESKQIERGISSGIARYMEKNGHKESRP